MLTDIIEKKLKVIVTGGAGFIGSHIAQACVTQGFEVRVVDNLSFGKKENIPQGAIFHQIDIRDTVLLRELFEELVDVYCVFHCAAVPMVQFSIDNPIESHDINVNGTINLLNMVKDFNVHRFVYSASCSVYGDQDVLPFTEDMEALPKSPYALQKYFGEVASSTYYRVYGVPTVSLRYFNVYGPGQDPTSNYAMVIAKFIACSGRGEPMTITGDGLQTRDFVFIDDVVQANLLAMESKKVGHGEVINIGSGVSTSISDIAKIIGGEIMYVPARIEPNKAQAGITRAKEILGWQPSVSVADGINLIKNRL